jgi:DNA (cytosine-5)-methyltransferase 1
LLEIIVDNFAGGGGASTGIEFAIGRSVDIAINHDPVAIAMHRVNHPNTEHFCESVWDVEPRKATKGRPVGLCWFSPDCKHFSKAKGGKPVEKHIRGLAWVAVRWAATVRPRVIILENVEEFKTWGPLLKNGKPDPKQKGKTFNAFINALRRQGYQVDYRELRACDYGSPTIRKRFFLVARCDSRSIVWPKPTHGEPNSQEVKSGRLKPWRTAAEIIDWSLNCPSIFERKRPLAENTMRRIARGIQKFVIDNPKPFIIKVNHHGQEFRGQQIDEPLQTITAKNGWGLVNPVIVRQFGKSVGHSIEEPLGTVTAGGGGKSQLVVAFLSKYHGETSLAGTRGQTPDEPIKTVDTSNRFALVTSHLVKFRGTNIGHPATEPLHTITASGLHLGEVRVFLLKYYGTNIGQSCDEPLQTITTKHRFGLVTVHGQDYQIVDIGMRMLEPHELFAAQGFPSDYVIDRDGEGNKFSKASQVARCGNAVPPQLAEHLVRVNLPEMCEIIGNVG